MIEVQAKLKNAKISPKKVRLVADAIRGLAVAQAQERLAVIFKKSAPVLTKLLRSAIANAKDRYDVKEEDLLVKSIMVNQGRDLKRWRPSAFGRAHPFSIHHCHIILVLGLKTGASAKALSKQAVAVETVDLTKVENKGATKPETTAAGKAKGLKEKIGKLKKAKEQNLDHKAKGVRVKKG